MHLVAGLARTLDDRLEPVTWRWQTVQVRPTSGSGWLGWSSTSSRWQTSHAPSKTPLPSWSLSKKEWQRKHESRPCASTGSVRGSHGPTTPRARSRQPPSCRAGRAPREVPEGARAPRPARGGAASGARVPGSRSGCRRQRGHPTRRTRAGARGQDRKALGPPQCSRARVAADAADSSIGMRVSR